MTGSRQHYTAIVLASVAYALLTLALTWPIPLHLRSVVPSDPGDPLLNTWVLAWNARTLPLTPEWWNAPQFSPLTGATAFTESLLGLLPITGPVIWLTGDPLLAYNLAFLLVFPLCALTMHALVFTLTRSHAAGLVAGLAFAFAPYRVSHVAHLHVLSSYWMPLCLLGLHRYLGSETRRKRWLVLFAGAWLLQALACGNYLFSLSLLAALWVAWFGLRRGAMQDVAWIMAAWAAAAALLVPLLYGYWTISRQYGLRRTGEEIESFSADIASLLQAPGDLLAWGWLRVVERAESELFPGLTVVLLTVLALYAGWRSGAARTGGFPRVSRVLMGGAVLSGGIFVARLIAGPFRLELGDLRLLSVTSPHKPLSVAVLCVLAVLLTHPAVRSAWHTRSNLAFYSLAAVVMWLMALGPAPTFLGQPALYKAPYAWLMLLPGVDGIRVPARFWMLAVLCLAVCAGLAVHRFTAAAPRFRRLLITAACAGILLDGWPARLRLAPRPDDRPNHARAAQRLDLPFGRTDTIALYRAALHHRALVNGYSGYFAPHYFSVERGLLDHDPAVLTKLAEHGAIEVSVDHEADGDGTWRSFVAGYPGVEQVFSNARYTSYLVPLQPERTTQRSGMPIPVVAARTPLNADLVSLMFDDDLRSRWHAGRQQEPGDWLAVDLGEPQPLAEVQMVLGGYAADFPRNLVIEGSDDGVAWRQIWSGRGAALTLAAALQEPRRIPISFPLSGHTARHLRFTQTGTEPIAYWSIAELRVLGATSSATSGGAVLSTGQRRDRDHANGCSREFDCGVNSRAPSSVITMSSSSRTPNSPRR